MRPWIVRLVIGWSVVAAAACTRSDRLTAIDDDVARDPRTQLEWTRHDAPQSLAWDEAERYCRDLAVGGRRGWRLPEIAEVQALYDKRFNGSCGDRTCHFDPAIGLRGPYLWSATAREPGSRFYFDASAGNSFSPGVTPRLVRRVLCVRGGAPAAGSPSPPAR
jgi:hypothetical protein